MTSDHDQSGDCPEDLESVDEEEDTEPKKNVAALDINRAIQHVEMMALLPPSVKRRVKALKKLQFEATKIKAEYFKELHVLDCKYQASWLPLYEKRSAIVNGKHEPTDEEADWPSDEEEEETGDEDELPEALKSKAKIDKKVEDKDIKGIPEFWLTVFKNLSLLFEMVQPHDIPLLNHLIDIKATSTEDPMGFLLQFHFSPNEYFTNIVLTKEYFMKCEPDEDDPFGFDGPEIYKCTGCTINWNKGKNVTLKTVKKKQKHKSSGVVRVVTKTVANDSFFNYFTPPIIPEGTKDEDVDEEVRNLLMSDFEIGHYIRYSVVPRAVLYFTGEGIEEEEEFEEEEDDKEDKEDDDDYEGNAKDDERCKQQ